MQIKETIGVSFPGSVESPPLEDVVVLVDSAGVALEVQQAFSARVWGVRDGGSGLIASRRVEIPLVGSDGEVSGVLCHTGPRSDTRGCGCSSARAMPRTEKPSSNDMQAASPSVKGVGTPGHHVTNDVDTAHPRSRLHTGSTALMFKLSIVCRIMTDFPSASSAAEPI